MSKRWDRINKKLMHRSPKTFLNLWIPEVEFLGAYPCELDGGRLVMDSLLHVRNERRQEQLVNCEMQTGNDLTMGKRLGSYFLEVSKAYPLLPVRSFGLHLLRDGHLPSSPLILPPPEQGMPEQMRFLYDTLDIGYTSCEELLGRDDVYQLPWLPLTDGGLDIRLVDKMFTDLQQHDNKALLDSSAVLASLAFERYKGDEQWLNWRIEMIDDLENLRIFQEYRQKGREEGITRIQTALIKLVRTRFPSLSRLARTRLSSIHSLAVLGDLIIKLGTVESAEEARHYLTDWEEIYKDLLKGA